MALNVTKCPSCNRLTPPKTGECFYCGKRLAGAAPGPAAAGPPPALPEEPRVLGNTAPRFRPQADDRGHYLIAESRDPVSLEAGKLFVIGRDPRTNLTIHGGDVSRQHAEIDWQGNPPRPLLCEVRSRNGTYLNERLVVRGEPQPLRNGDRIRLGGAFTLLYLNVPERELRRELSERSLEETRELRGSAAPPPPPEPAASVVLPPPERIERPEREKIEPPPPPPRPTRIVPRPPGAPRRTQVLGPLESQVTGRVLPSGDELEHLVAAAMGEAPVSTPLQGDLAELSASDLLRELVEKKASGVLTVFEGAHSGEVVLAEGQCQQAVYGRVQGRPALQHIVRLRRGTYRFRPGDVTRTGGIDELPLPSAGEEAPPDPLSEGSLEALSARDLIKALLSDRRTGVLTVFAGHETGEAAFVDGVCERAALGGLAGREALDAITALQQGAYRFRADSAARASRSPVDDLTSGWSGTWHDVNDWQERAPVPAAAPPPPPRATTSVAAPRPAVEDPWEVDPDDTLMPGSRDAFRIAQPPALDVGDDRPTITDREDPPEPVAAAAPGVVPPPAEGDDDRRIPPLRSKRYAPEPWSNHPLRSGPGPAPKSPPAPRSPTVRRAPPPLPPPRPASSDEEPV